MGQPPLLRSAVRRRDGGASDAGDGGGTHQLPLLRHHQGRRACHGGAAGGAVRRRDAGCYRGGAGAAEHRQGHHLQAGHGDLRRLPGADGTASGHGVSGPVRAAGGTGHAAVPHLRSRCAAPSPGGPLSAGGGALRRGLCRCGRDRSEHGLRRRQPLPHGGGGAVRAGAQSGQRPCVPAPAQAAGGHGAAHRRPTGAGGAGAGYAGEPWRRGGGADRTGGCLLPAPDVSGRERDSPAAAGPAGCTPVTGPGRGEADPGDGGAAGHRLCPSAASGGGVGGPHRRAAADRRPRHRQDHLHTGHRGPFRGHGPSGAAAGPHRPCRQAHERAVPPGGPDHPPGAGYDL